MSDEYVWQDFGDMKPGGIVRARPEPQTDYERAKRLVELGRNQAWERVAGILPQPTDPGLNLVGQLCALVLEHKARGERVDELEADLDLIAESARKMHHFIARGEWLASDEGRERQLSHSALIDALEKLTPEQLATDGVERVAAARADAELAALREKAAKWDAHEAEIAALDDGRTDFRPYTRGDDPNLDAQMKEFCARLKVDWTSVADAPSGLLTEADQDRRSVWGAK